MEPRWTRLTSSLLDSVSYNPAESRLRIRFRSGAIFEYDAVPPVIYEELLAAPSKGEYFYEYIRPDYLYRRMQGVSEGVAVPTR